MMCHCNWCLEETLRCMPQHAPLISCEQGFHVIKVRSGALLGQSWLLHVPEKHEGSSHLYKVITTSCRKQMQGLVALNEAVFPSGLTGLSPMLAGQC